MESRRPGRALDALNVLLADVRGAPWPYLVTQLHWSQALVGLVTTVSGWLGFGGASASGGADRSNAVESVG